MKRFFLSALAVALLASSAMAADVTTLTEDFETGNTIGQAPAANVVSDIQNSEGTVLIAAPKFANGGGANSLEILDNQYVQTDPATYAGLKVGIPLCPEGAVIEKGSVQFDIRTQTGKAGVIPADANIFVKFQDLFTPGEVGTGNTPAENMGWNLAFRSNTTASKTTLQSTFSTADGAANANLAEGAWAKDTDYRVNVTWDLTVPYDQATGYITQTVKSGSPDYLTTVHNQTGHLRTSARPTMDGISVLMFDTQPQQAAKFQVDNIIAVATDPAAEVKVLDGTAGVASAGTVDVGDVVVNEPAIEKTLTIKNIGLVDLTTADLAVTGDFALKSGETLVATLAPGAEDTVTVEMAATTEGDKTGTLTFTTNDSDEATYTVNLIGTVDPFTAAEEWTQYEK